MIHWLKSFKEADSQTKYFILNWGVYGIAVIVSTVYCYSRLDYVRSYDAATHKEHPHSIQSDILPQHQP
jgi:hypothetical protein